MNPMPLNDDAVMNLVDLALSQPESERRSYVESACGDNADLFHEVWNFVVWEQRMQGFLLDPVIAAPPQPSGFRPGQILAGRFRIVRELAHGGMGVVYEAHDEKLQRRIALKCAKPGHGNRLPPEVRHASEISHPNVCRIFEIHTASTGEGEVDFITMEFLDGETLSKRLRRGPLLEREARNIASQLAAGLAEAHRQQVIHGDLKSSNVILTTADDGTPRAVITDFGLARSPGASQSTLFSAEPGGTPAYMAPELWRGQKASQTSDIYAMGVILYELASGRPPHERVPDEAGSSGTSASTATAIPWVQRLKLQPAPVSPKWDRILARCLHPDPSRRFSSADELSRALGPSRTRRRILGVAAAVLLAAVSGLFTYQRATAPVESVRLSLLPIEQDSASLPTADQLHRESADRLARVRGSARTSFEISVPGAAGATHAVRARIRKQDDNWLVRLSLTDLGKQLELKDWSATYEPAELRFVPAALSGLVTWTFHLPLPESGNVNAAARQDYQNGLRLLRQDSTVPAALASLEKAASADSNSALTYAALAEAQFFQYLITREKSWLEQSTASARKARLRHPDLPEVHRIAGLLERDSGRYEAAAAEYRRAIELAPNNGDTYRRLGQVHMQLDQFVEALAAYKRAVELDPGNYRNHHELGAYFNRQAKYGEAIPHIRRAIQQAPNEPNPHFSLGTTFLNLGQYADAEREMRLALGIAETPMVLHALGLTLMYQSRDKEAALYISRALERGPPRYLWWLNLGNAHRRAGDAAASRTAYRHGLGLAEKQLIADPRNGRVRAHLAYMYARLGDRNRAASELEQALRLMPRDADTQFMAAVTYYALGERDRMIEVLTDSAPSVVSDFSRWPDVAELHLDPRFRKLLAVQRP
jgi:serine/threonine protein kinase/tetratricopeptide (TPR) repeat protein